MSTTVNELILNAKIPGRIFQLPSRGIFYTNDELVNSTNGEIHVQALSAFDEIIMKNPDQLYSGNAVNKVLPRCIEHVAKPLELASKDVDAIMVFLRIVTFGPMYDITTKHTCANAKEHTYQINLDEIAESIKYIDPADMDSIFSVTLKNGQHIKLSPTKYSTILNVVKKAQNKTELTVEEELAGMYELLENVIISVDGITDRAKISEWIRIIPSRYLQQISDKLESIDDWGVNMDKTLICPDCGEPMTITLPLNPVYFFID